MFHRTGEAWRSDRLTLNKEVLSPQVVDSFVPLLDQVSQDFVRRARAQVQQSGRERWTADFSHELFRFALECEFAPLPQTSPKCTWDGWWAAFPLATSLGMLLPQRFGRYSPHTSSSTSDKSTAFYGQPYIATMPKSSRRPGVGHRGGHTVGIP